MVISEAPNFDLPQMQAEHITTTFAARLHASSSYQFFPSDFTCTKSSSLVKYSNPKTNSIEIIL